MRVFKTISKFLTGFLCVLVFLWLAGGASYLVKIKTPRPDMPNVKTEAIVVLTGGNDRIGTGLGLWADGLAPELFISGVHKNTSRAQILNNWSGEKRLPFCCLTLGYEANTTIENAIEVKEWIDRNKIRTIRLVTSDYHMPRASLEIKNALPDVRIYLHPVKEVQHSLNEPYFRYVVFEEYHKYLWRNFQILTGYEGEPWKLL